MPQFSRRTIIAAVETLDNWTNSEINRFALEHELEATGAIPEWSKMDRATGLIKFLLNNHQLKNTDGRSLIDAIVWDLVERAIKRTSVASWNPRPFEEAFPRLAYALARDGFIVQDGKLRRALPETLNLPQADDEVHALLNKFDLTVPIGHLDQATEAHARGDWAAANAQLRPFVESLLDEIAVKLATDPTILPTPGHARRTWLWSTLKPPFLLDGLNEWDGQGKGFIEGFYRRLHPQGSHPGLSDKDDSTFRLHLVLLVARLLLRRLDDRATGNP